MMEFVPLQWGKNETKYTKTPFERASPCAGTHALWAGLCAILFLLFTFMWALFERPLKLYGTFTPLPYFLAW